MKNYYLRLLIGMAATPDEVKRAYHRLAREHHPDAASGSAASFVELREAYDVLGTETKRAQYDEQRRAWAKKIGAFLCASCGTANHVRRRPNLGEQVSCAACDVPLPLDLAAAVLLQKQRLVAEAARVVDDVGAELATTAIDLAKAGLQRLRRRWTRS